MRYHGGASTRPILRFHHYEKLNHTSSSYTIFTPDTQ